MTTEPERRRRRPAVSCQRCRKSKIRCNRESPCNNCIRSKVATSCTYPTHSQSRREALGRGRGAEHEVMQTPPNLVTLLPTSSTSTEPTLPGHQSSSTAGSTSIIQSSVSDIDSLKNKIKQLEEQLSGGIASPVGIPQLTSDSGIAKSNSRIAGDFYVHHGRPSLGQPGTISRCVTHKSRTYGQSHWINVFSLFLDLPEMVETHREEAAGIASGVQKCKSLAKIIKSQRAPPWPCSPTADLPPKSIADELVDGYLRTTETFYRILHVPSFRRDYEALWVSNTVPDTAFLLLVKLVLAIGALIFDEDFSMRTATMRWIYEAQTWLSGPKFKSRLDLQSLQTEILLLLARELVNTGGEPMWMSAGALLRKAVFMGLHRDPTSLPITSEFAVEMRRRLWNTILEINLQSSLTSGGPPLISFDDFDTMPPGNFDDDQLNTEAPVPKQESDFTKASIAIALRKTFPIRLEVTKFLNNLKSQGTYEETLRLDTELRAAIKTLSRSFQACNSRAGPSVSRYETRVVDFIMHRYLAALHIPFFGPSLKEAGYAFSRKVVIETSLKTWYAAYPLSAVMGDRSRHDTIESEGDDLGRLIACGSGFSRMVVWQAAILVALELRAQLHEDESLDLTPLRPDLLSVLHDAQTWCLQCIRAGELNTKGYLLICVLTAQIDGLRRGVGKDEIPRLLIKASEHALETCLPILEQMASAGSGDRVHETASSTPLALMEDWDFMMSDTMFGMGNADPLSWMFNNEVAEGTSIL